MKINKKIRYAFVLFCWLLIGSGVLVLLVAAINIKNRETCRAINIDISGVEEFFFLDKQDVRNIITKGSAGKPEGRPVTSFNLQQLEETLEQNVWVRDAELYFDNNMVLHVNISEREPVARVFTTSGKSFYIDSSAHVMPLSEKMNVRIPVFTGFPSDNMNLSRPQAALMKQLKDVAMYISQHPFFKAQVAQVDITASKNFEMVPVIGNHIIELGAGNNLDNKFRALYLFYQQVLSKAGFDIYSRISVQYAKQVVGTRRGFAGKIDSVQAVKNIQNLIDASKKMTTDSVFTLVDKNTSILKKADSTLSVYTTPRDTGLVVKKPTQDLPPKNNPVKTYSSQHPLKKQETNPSNINVKPKPKPKAVMPKLQ